jgi:hypothetical protein
MLRWLFLGLWTMAWVSGACGQDKDFRAELNRDQVSANESFRITFKLSGKGHSFQPPSFRYFNVVWGPAKSIKRKSVNGNFSMTMSYTYKLRPKRKGSFRIGSAEIVKNGETLKSDPLTLKVTEKADQGENDKASQESITKRIRENLYIKCSVNNTKPYRGEQIKAVYKLFINVGVTDYEVKHTPQFNGFWKETIKDPEKFRVKVERVNGQRFKTAVLSKVALFPQRAGNLTLDPFKMKFNVRYRADGNGGGVFSRFRREYKTKTLTVSSNPVEIDVKPLPDQPSKGFSGLVGQFELSSQLSSSQTVLNKPVELKLSLSGRGNLNKLQPLKLNLSRVFSHYQPETNSRVSAKSGVVKGAKTFEYPIVPRSPGRHEIDPISFTYFNPHKERYITESTPSYTIRVRPRAKGADSMLPGSELLANQPAVQSIEKDIRYIKTSSDTLSKNPLGFVFSAPFWGLTLAPFLLIGGLVWWQKAKGGLPAVQDSSNAKTLANRQLKNAERAINSDEQEAFYEAMSWALWGYAGKKLGIKVSEMTQEQVQQRLLSYGVNRHAVEELLELIQCCEMATYTPSGSNTTKQDLHQRAVKLINNLEAEFTGS